MLLASVEKDVSKSSVVDTGIFILVRISKKIGAATCKKEKLVGVVSKPLDANRHR